MRRWLFRLIGVCKNDALAVMHNYCLYMMLFSFVGLHFSIHVQYGHIYSFGLLFSWFVREAESCCISLLTCS
jgi:hypothetical protein